MKLAAKPNGARQALDQHLEQPGIIGGAQGVVAMHQVDLELAKPGFRGGGVGGNVHRLAGVIKVGEEGVEGVQRPDRQGLGGLAALAGTGLRRHPQLLPESSIRKNSSSIAHHGVRPRPCSGRPRAQRMARIALIGACRFRGTSRSAAARSAPQARASA
jgi:hypothetical protein